jgi:putative ABC transport system permease protein
MHEGVPDSVHMPDSVIVDELFLDALGVRRIGDEAELYGRRAVVRGISSGVRTLTASPFVFTSIDTARKFDRRYGPDEITYVLVRCSPGSSPQAVRDELRVAIPHAEVLTSREFAARTMQYWMLETGLGITVVLTAILGLTVSVVITSQTLFTITNEHLRNYSTLAAVGFSKLQLLACICVQALTLTTGGVVIGSFFFGVAAHLSSRTPLPLETLPEVYAALVAVSMGSSLAGAVLSLRSVIRLDPATVFRG